MAVKRIFISMPMSGKSREEIEQARHDALVALGDNLKDEVELVESYLDGEYSPLGCLGESLKRMATADYVAFVEGCENARGCRIERTCAREYGIPYFDFGGDKKWH